MDYSIMYPEVVNAGENFTVRINAKNSQNHSQTIYAWSYVYKSNKCLSCDESNDRESNKIEVDINAGEEEEISLQNSVNDVENGTYKLKIKILKEGLKTPKEYTLSITVLNVLIAQAQTTEKEDKTLPTAQTNTNMTSLIYESKSERDKKVAFYLFNVMSLVIIILAYRKGLNKPPLQ